MHTQIPAHFRKLRSFVRRDGRLTTAQERARVALWPHVGLKLQDGQANFDTIFGREAPRFLEIGFGSGQSLLALAEAQQDSDFIGIETHKPGIGALCLGIEVKSLSNLRIYYDDAVEILKNCIPDASLTGVQIFFPDPWQKRRHHARRIVQADFVQLVITKLKPAGTLHLATDWEDYAKHMMRVISNVQGIENIFGDGQYAARSPYRPILTKFERRAEREGRGVWELQLRKL